MSRHMIMVRVLLTALAALLLLAAPAASGGGVVHYGGSTATQILISDFSSATPLPGGRLLLEGRIVREYYQCDPGDGPDLVSGWYLAHMSAIMEPGGTLLAWGDVVSEDLDYWPNPDSGGIRGIFDAVVTQDGLNFALNSKTLGWGEMEGIRGWHHEFWEGTEVRFFGHYQEP
ncbi:MAG: hypothetical protein R6X16_05125 [Anaerolineae bacterium]